MSIFICCRFTLPYTPVSFSFIRSDSIGETTTTKWRKFQRFIETIWPRSVGFTPLSLSFTFSLPFSLSICSFSYIFYFLFLSINIYTCIYTIRINLCVRTCGLLRQQHSLFGLSGTNLEQQQQPQRCDWPNVTAQMCNDWRKPPLISAIWQHG